MDDFSNIQLDSLLKLGSKLPLVPEKVRDKVINPIVGVYMMIIRIPH